MKQVVSFTASLALVLLAGTVMVWCAKTNSDNGPEIAGVVGIGCQGAEPGYAVIAAEEDMLPGQCDIVRPIEER